MRYAFRESAFCSCSARLELARAQILLVRLNQPHEPRPVPLERLDSPYRLRLFTAHLPFRRAIRLGLPVVPSYPLLLALDQTLSRPVPRVLRFQLPPFHTGNPFRGAPYEPRRSCDVVCVRFNEHPIGSDGPDEAGRIRVAAGYVDRGGGV